MKLALVGQAAAGKDTIANYISKKYNLPHVSSGDLIRGYVIKNNLGDLDRPNLQKVANKLRTEQGGDILVKIALEKEKGDLILSGLRSIEEVESFEKLGGKIIAVTAPSEKRYEWSKRRRRVGDDVSFEEFKKLEEMESKNPDKKSQNINKVISMSDIKIENNGTLDDLFKKCDEVMEKIN